MDSNKLNTSSVEHHDDIINHTFHLDGDANIKNYSQAKVFTKTDT